MAFLTSPISIEQYTIPETMRSAVLFGPRDIRVIDRPLSPAWSWRSIGESGHVWDLRERSQDLRRAFPSHPTVWRLYAR